MCVAQGMNFIAGWLLLVYGLQSEQEAFGAFAAFLEQICPDYFSRSLIGSMVDQVSECDA